MGDTTQGSKEEVEENSKKEAPPDVQGNSQTPLTDYTNVSALSNEEISVLERELQSYITHFEASETNSAMNPEQNGTIDAILLNCSTQVVDPNNNEDSEINHRPNSLN